MDVRLLGKQIEGIASSSGYRVWVPALAGYRGQRLRCWQPAKWGYRYGGEVPRNLGNLGISE